MTLAPTYTSSSNLHVHMKLEHCLILSHHIYSFLASSWSTPFCEPTSSKSLCTNPDERQVDPKAKFCTFYRYTIIVKLHVICSSMLILSNMHYHYPKEFESAKTHVQVQVCYQFKVHTLHSHVHTITLTQNTHTYNIPHSLTINQRCLTCIDPSIPTHIINPPPTPHNPLRLH